MANEPVEPNKNTHIPAGYAKNITGTPAGNVTAGINLEMIKQLIAGLGNIKVRLYPQDPLVSKEPAETIFIFDPERVSLHDGLPPGRDTESVPSPQQSLPQPNTSGSYYYEPSDPRFPQTNALITATGVLYMADKYLGHKAQWQNERLYIYTPPPGARQKGYYGPSHQVPYNACYGVKYNILILPSYNQEDLQMLCNSKNAGNIPEILHTANSADTVSHETGHAILESMLKPDLRLTPQGEWESFNEAFADCTSMLSYLFNDSSIELLAEETEGDFSKSCTLSRISEQSAFFFSKYSNDINRAYLRDLNNNFKYTDRLGSNLPDLGTDTVLGSEPHSFSRIFSGAFYDLFRHKYNEALGKILSGKKIEKPEKPDIISALKIARDSICPLLFKAVELTPKNKIDFKTVALCMLKADEIINKGGNKGLILKTFTDRNILNADDLKKYEDKEKNIPDVKIKKIPSNDKEAIIALNSIKSKLGLDGYKITDAKVIRDNYGCVIIQYITATQLKDAERKNNFSSSEIGGELDLIGVWGENFLGGTIVFNAEGKLIFAVKDL